MAYHLTRRISTQPKAAGLATLASVLSVKCNEEFEVMEYKVELESKSAPRIKKAAQKISKARLQGYEQLLLVALDTLISKPKSWEAQSKVIRTLGVTGSKKSLPYLNELSCKEFEATILYLDLGFSIFMLQDIANKEYKYLESILEQSNDSLLAGVCSAILFSEVIPPKGIITKLLSSTVGITKNEGQVISPRCYLAAACYSWPQELTQDFLQRCSKSTWSTLREISNDSMAGKKTKYALV